MKYEAEIWYVRATYDAEFDYHIPIRINCPNRWI